MCYLFIFSSFLCSSLDYFGLSPWCKERQYGVWDHVCGKCPGWEQPRSPAAPLGGLSHWNHRLFLQLHWDTVMLQLSYLWAPVRSPGSPLGRCGRVNEAWRRHGKARVPEMTDDLVRIITSFCRQRGKLKTRLVFGVPPPLLSPRRIWFKGENQDGRRLRAGRKSWQLLRKVRKLAREVHL